MYLYTANMFFWIDLFHYSLFRYQIFKGHKQAMKNKLGLQQLVITHVQALHTSAHEDLHTQT